MTRVSNGARDLAKSLPAATCFGVHFKNGDGYRKSKPAGLWSTKFRTRSLTRDPQYVLHVRRRRCPKVNIEFLT